MDPVDDSASWLPLGYAEIALESAGVAVEASMLLTRLITDQAAAALVAHERARAEGHRLPALVCDMVAGAALHAGEFAAAQRVLDDFWGNPHESVQPVLEQVLRVKQFAAACVLGEQARAEEFGVGLLAHAAEQGDHAIAAIVWSAYAVLRAADGDRQGLDVCRERFEALTWDPRLEVTRAGTSGLLDLAQAAMGASPAVLVEPWLSTLLARAVPLTAMASDARAFGRSLSRTEQLVEFTDRRQQVLRLVASGSTDAAIARQLGVAPRTVQGDVAALKAIHGVTGRAALVAASRPITGGSGHLTPRQRAVVELVQRGFTNRGIAATLGISQRTVERHIAQAAARAGVVGRTQLALLEHG